MAWRPRVRAPRSLKTEQHASDRGARASWVEMARFSTNPVDPAARREPRRSGRHTQLGSSPPLGAEAISEMYGIAPPAPAVRTRDRNFFMESLILAQDERWRRA
jgi:hypothetical protein